MAILTACSSTELPELRVEQLNESATKSCSPINQRAAIEIADMVLGKTQMRNSSHIPNIQYVMNENPGCPVGCVAVASAIVMSYSQPLLS